MVKRHRKKEKDPAAVSLGSRGGKARARNLTAERLREIGLTGSRARWGKPQAEAHKK